MRIPRDVERSLWVGFVLAAFVVGAILQHKTQREQFECPMGSTKSVAVVFCQGSMFADDTITAIKYRFDEGRWTPEYRQDVTEDGK